MPRGSKQSVHSTQKKKIIKDLWRMNCNFEPGPAEAEISIMSLEPQKEYFVTRCKNSQIEIDDSLV